MEMPQKVVDYINENRGSLPPVTNVDEPLQIDSLSRIRLVAFLESDLGIRIEDDELLAENCATSRKLGDLLAGKEPLQVAAPVQSTIVALIARRGCESSEATA